MFPDKVLLITFWATWSVKSTQAIEQLEKVKKNFKDKDIIYIYLSDGSSPLKTWENRIQYISGEHFRLRDSQLNFLKNSLNLNGNPSFLILNKKRKQVYKKEGYNYYEIQQELRKLLK